MESALPTTPRIVGPYTLGAELASGGMGTVHLGEARAPGRPPRPVAIKRIRPQFAGDPAFVAMFLDEARLAAMVLHPNVVATLDVLADAADLFLVMEYIAGAALSSALLAGPVPPAVASRVLLDVLAGLHAAHEARDAQGKPLEIVHRDVSPPNVLVGEDGRARLADFGIARARVRFHATTPGQLKGKLRYMAPEQLRGATATRRSDLYAVCVVIWEALTGRQLFVGETHSEILDLVLSGNVAPPSELSSAAAAVDAVVLRGLARDPAQRFATALDLGAALAGALAPAPPAEVAAWLRAATATELAAHRACLEATR